MLKILVADSIAQEGLDMLKAAEGVSFDVRPGLPPAELSAAIGDYDGMIIRSGVQITADVLARPGRLRAIARAGVGVDNVDLAAATAAGVLVMNTPDANTVSTAEHAVAMMMALARHIPAAHQHVAAGQWKRAQFLGGQLAGKTLGIVGFGRVGRAVAQRALGLQMKVLAHDPFVREDAALDGRVELVPDLDALIPQVDVLTLHAAMADGTRHLIGRERLARFKPTALLVNCARGALVDENALAEALNAGALAGAAIDVFEHEPPAGCPLLACRNIVLTPHLGASTVEAQNAVSTDAVDAMLAYLLRGEIRNAVNVAGLPVDLTPRDRAFFDLVGRMAAILSCWSGDGVDRVEVTVAGGEALGRLRPALALQALAGLMNPHIEGRLNLVNAGDFARQRGIEIQHAARTARQDVAETVRVTFTRGAETHAVEGAVFVDGRPRILAIDGYRMEMVPAGALVMIFNDDRPGVIGLVGTLFGNHAVNIADMTLSRRDKTALMVLRLDSPAPQAVVAELRASPAILAARTVSLPELPPQQ